MDVLMNVRRFMGAFYSFWAGREQRFGEKRRAALRKGAAYCFRAFSLRPNRSARAQCAADGWKKLLPAMPLLMLAPAFTQHPSEALARGRGPARWLPRRRGPVRLQMAGR